MDKGQFRREYLDFIDTVVNKRLAMLGIAVQICKEASEIVKLFEESDVPIKTCSHSIMIIELVSELEKKALELIKGVKKFERKDGIRIKENRGKVAE